MASKTGFKSGSIPDDGLFYSLPLVTEYTLLLSVLGMWGKITRSIMAGDENTDRFTARRKAITVSHVETYVYKLPHQARSRF